MATTDAMAFRYFVESTYGDATPSPAPALNTLLITSESLTTNFDTVESEAVVGDRQVQDIVRVGQIGEGDINAELNYSNLDDLFQGALADEWLSNVLENSSTLISYGLEKDMTDLSKYYRFVGARVNTLSVNMALQSMITGTVGVMAKGGIFANATIGDGSPVASTTNPSMVTLSTLTITEAGGAITCPTAFSFQTTNELRQKRCLGEDDISGINLGIFRASGTLEAYFEDRSLVDKVTADTPTYFEVVTQDSDGNSYTFTFPQVKFMTLDGPANTGRSQDLMQTFAWTAYKDVSSGITMQITRAPA